VKLGLKYAKTGVSFKGEDQVIVELYIVAGGPCTLVRSVNSFPGGGMQETRDSLSTSEMDPYYVSVGEVFIVGYIVDGNERESKSFMIPLPP
jgi:hypothetical protein